RISEGHTVTHRVEAAMDFAAVAGADDHTVFVIRRVILALPRGPIHTQISDAALQADAAISRKAIRVHIVNYRVDGPDDFQAKFVLLCRGLDPEVTGDRLWRTQDVNVHIGSIVA